MLTSYFTHKMITPTFFEFWSELFLKPKVFFKKNLVDAPKKMPYFILAFLIFGIGNGIDRLDGQMAKFDLQGNLAALESMNHWSNYWAISILGGIIGSLLLYFIAGWFYNVRVKWSKGESNIQKSRAIFLYSGNVLYAYLILTALISMTMNEKPYQTEGSFNTWDQITLALLVFFAFYSIYVSYCGAMSVKDIDKTRARIWFLILPSLFYALVYVGVVFLVFKSILFS